MSTTTYTATTGLSSTAVRSDAVAQKPVHGIPDVSSSREYAYRLGTRLLACDWVVAALSICAGLLVRELARTDWETGSLDHLAVKPLIYAWSLGGACVFAWFMAFFRSYEPQSLYRFNLTLKNTFKSTLLCAVAVWAIVGIFGIQEYAPRLGVVISCGILLVTMGIWRLIAYSMMIRPNVRAAASSKVVVIGWNDNAERLLRATRNNIANLTDVIGCVPMPGGKFDQMPPRDVPVLGDYSDLRNIALQHKANSIVLADVSCPAREIEGLIRMCQADLLNFKMVPEYFPALRSGLNVETLSGVPLLGIYRLPLDRTRSRLIKRAVDIVGALFGLLVSAPIMSVFMAIVYMESPGPVIYRQLRTTRNGRNFYIYKIRSMKLNAESGTGAVWCKQEDDRRLKIGALMRKTNVDELPQFWNVLIGDMSLVGPRPERPELIAKFKDQIPNYNDRHKVRAGLTGWAQINGWRGDTDLTKRIEADLYYLENWSFTMDIYCMVATFFKVKNAY